MPHDGFEQGKAPVAVAFAAAAEPGRLVPVGFAQTTGNHDRFAVDFPPHVCCGFVGDGWNERAAEAVMRRDEMNNEIAVACGRPVREPGGS